MAMMFSATTQHLTALRQWLLIDWGKEAAVFVASGTMGNLVSILTHAGRGDEIIIGDKAHIFRSEAGGASALGGVAYNTLPNDHRGMLDLDELEAAIKPPNVHFTVPR